MRYLALLSMVTAQLLAQGTQEVLPDTNDLLVSGVPAVSTSCPPGAQAYGVIAGGTDLVDWYSFQLTAAQDVRIWTGPSHPSYATPIGDTVLQLRDANGIVLEVDDGAVATHGFYSKMLISSLAAGSYFVGVRGFSPLITGGYTLDVCAAPVGTMVPQSPLLRPVFSGVEPNDPQLAGGIATPSAIGTRNEGLISPGGGGVSLAPGLGDYDWFSFTVSTTSVVTLSTRAPGGPTPLQPAINNTVLHLLDSNFNRIAFNDDDVGTTYSRIRRELTPGLFYVAINGFSAADTGYYWLDIQGPAASIGPVASVTEQQPQNPNCFGAIRRPHLGVRGVNVGPVVVRPEQPIAGSSFCLDVENVTWPVYMLVGSFGAGTSDLGTINPVFAGCFTEIDLTARFELLPMPFTPATTTVHYWLSSVPLTASLLGQSYDVQAGGGDPLSPLTLTLTNRCTISIGMTH